MVLSVCWGQTRRLWSGCVAGIARNNASLSSAGTPSRVGDAVSRHESRVSDGLRRQAGPDDCLTSRFEFSELTIEREKVLQDIHLAGNAICGRHGCIESGMRLLERRLARHFQGSIERAKGQAVGGPQLRAELAQRDGGLRDAPYGLFLSVLAATYLVPPDLQKRCCTAAAIAVVATRGRLVVDFSYLKDLVPEFNGDEKSDEGDNWGTALDALRDARCVARVNELAAQGEVLAGFINPLEFLELKRIHTSGVAA